MIDFKLINSYLGFMLFTLIFSECVRKEDWETLALLLEEYYKIKNAYEVTQYLRFTDEVIWP